VLLAALLLGFATSALADAPFYLGDWTIDKALVAPWADAARKPDTAEMKSLVGKAVSFKDKQILGPKILACKSLKYEVMRGGADMLFQGALAEKAGGSLQNANKLAAGLGFQGTTWKVLQTGCGNELDFSFVDNDTAEFGLNDYVYVMKRK